MAKSLSLNIRQLFSIAAREYSGLASRQNVSRPRAKSLILNVRPRPVNGFEPHRHASGSGVAHINTIINFVPQQEAWVIERMGRFYRILDPGLNVLVPVIDRIKYVQSLKEIAIEIPQQGAITVDNVALHLDGVLYLKVIDPYKASYGVEDPEFAITQLAQTTMRSEVGKISLDTVFRERETLNENIVMAINKAADPWGLTCLRYEIRDMKMPPKIQEAMQMQVEAERRKRATVLESEGMREAAVNVAEGEKKATILASEAHRQEINRATGEAEAIVAKAKARAAGIHSISESLDKKAGGNAASLIVAEQYVGAFSKLAKEGNTVILSADVADTANMVAQAMSVYKKLSLPSPSSPESVSVVEDINPKLSSDNKKT